MYSSKSLYGWAVEENGKVENMLRVILAACAGPAHCHCPPPTTRWWTSSEQSAHTRRTRCLRSATWRTSSSSSRHCPPVRLLAYWPHMHSLPSPPTSPSLSLSMPPIHFLTSTYLPFHASNWAPSPAAAHSTFCRTLHSAPHIHLSFPLPACKNR